MAPKKKYLRPKLVLATSAIACLNILLLAFNFFLRPGKIKLDNVLTLSPIPSYTLAKNIPAPTDLKTNIYLIQDVQTGQVLLQSNSSLRAYPASTTKLLTAITALNIYPLDEVVTVTQEYKDGKVMGLKVGERLKISDLISSLLIYSANDAAYTLANHHPDGVAGFVQSMNQYAQKLNLTSTHFQNVDGTDDPNHYTTAANLAQIGRLAWQNPVVKATVGQTEITIQDLDHKYTHKLTTTNELLGKTPEIIGLKTGWTPTAGESFVGLIHYDNRDFITVVMQTTDRFGDTLKLLSWLKQSIPEQQ